MNADHAFPGPDAPCARCGMSFGMWAMSRARCVPEPEPPPDPLWEAVVACATGTNAADHPPTGDGEE